jgi:hypothetical protein
VEVKINTKTQSSQWTRFNTSPSSFSATSTKTRYYYALSQSALLWTSCPHLWWKMRKSRKRQICRKLASKRTWSQEVTQDPLLTQPPPSVNTSLRSCHQLRVSEELTTILKISSVSLSRYHQWTTQVSREAAVVILVSLVKCQENNLLKNFVDIVNTKIITMMKLRLVI